MSNSGSISLTASEIGYLWTGYSINEMSKWFLKAFHEQSNDKDVKDVYKYALQVTNDMLNDRKIILSEAAYPIPVGFSETDIDTSCAQLFSDRFLLNYLLVGTRLGLGFHSKALVLATRLDVRKHHHDCINSSIQLYEKVVNILINKGFYWRTPPLPVPTSPEYVQKSSYLNGWFEDTRPINSMEMANLYETIDLLNMIESLSIGFAQTSDSEEIVELFQKGVKIIKKQYSELVEILKEDELPITPSYSAELTESKERVLSDRIMVTHLAGLFGSLLSQYGYSLGSVMKHDLVTAYTTQITKTGAFAEKITRFLIEKEWLEKVPGAISRENL